VDAPGVRFERCLFGIESFLWQMLKNLRHNNAQLTPFTSITLKKDNIPQYS